MWLSNLSESTESQLALTPNKENQSVMQKNLFIFCGKTFLDLLTIFETKFSLNMSLLLLTSNIRPLLKTKLCWETLEKAIKYNAKII